MFELTPCMEKLNDLKLNSNELSIGYATYVKVGPSQKERPTFNIKNSNFFIGTLAN